MEEFTAILITFGVIGVFFGLLGWIADQIERRMEK